LIVSADHGVDPTTTSTDHSREYVPLLLYPRPANAPDKVYEGDFSDTGATVFSALTGREASLAGRSLERLEPSRGWRRYTALLDPIGDGSEALPVRLGPADVAEAAHFLADFLGTAPEVAIVLGSGLADGVRLLAGPAEGYLPSVSYDAIPHWPVGSVMGHPQVLEIADWEGSRIALLEGRVHAYEGFDASELQFAVRAMAAWGVKKVILTCAAGAVAAGLRPGSVVLVDEVLDFQNPRADGEPRRLTATGDGVISVAVHAGLPSFLQVGFHAAVPGPQYETPTELSVLSALGASCVSMSLPAEIRAAQEEGLDVAALSLVTNAGSTDHHEVLDAASSYRDNIAMAIASVLASWESP
jgi:purine-nucleoside phosphorylase